MVAGHWPGIVLGSLSSAFTTECGTTPNHRIGDNIDDDDELVGFSAICERLSEPTCLIQTPRRSSTDLHPTLAKPRRHTQKHKIHIEAVF